jgi:hypothetical protein
MVPDIKAESGATWTASAALNWNGVVAFGTDLAFTLRAPDTLAAGTRASVACISASSHEAVTVEDCVIDAAQSLVAFAISAPSALGVYSLEVTVLGPSGNVVDVLKTPIFGTMP